MVHDTKALWADQPRRGSGAQRIARTSEDRAENQSRSGELRGIVLRRIECQPVALWLFGSRARGDHRSTSDVDFAIDIRGPIPLSLLSDPAEAFEECTAPYRVDLLDLRASLRRGRTLGRPRERTEAAERMHDGARARAQRDCTGGNGSGTRFWIAGRLCKYAKMSRKSSSRSVPIAGHGIGGRISRPRPM